MCLVGRLLAAPIVPRWLSQKKCLTRRHGSEGNRSPQIIFSEFPGDLAALKRKRQKFTKLAQPGVKESMTLPKFATIRKFWLYDSSANGHKGHPRTLVAFQRGSDGTIFYAHTTWNPDDDEPFDRTQAVRRVEGRLKCPKRFRTTSDTCGAHKSILKAMMAADERSGRTSTARYRVCHEAYVNRKFKTDTD